TPVLREHAELVVAVGHAGPVAQLLFDGQGLLVAAFGLGVVTAGLYPYLRLPREIAVKGAGVCSGI
ncbi:hypothetical protein LXN57_47050, partial [Actinoplanes sp. TRM88002]